MGVSKKPKMPAGLHTPISGSKPVTPHDGRVYHAGGGLKPRAKVSGMAGQAKHPPKFAASTKMKGGGAKNLNKR